MVVLGKISEPYGVRGWVRVHPFADDPQAWAKMSAWWLGGEGVELWRQTNVKSARLHGDGLVCLFDGVDDRRAAEALKGLLVGAPREALPDAGEDQYYWADLIGLEVLNLSGVSLGKVAGLIETGANAVLRVVSVDGQERLLPFVGQIVRAVEKTPGVVRVDWESHW